jgi:xanthine dehydrogenase YagR molybdenum-binding subunit
VRIGDTAFPIGPASGGSKTIDSLSPAVRNAAHQARQAFVAQLASAHGVEPAQVTLAGGKVSIEGKSAAPFRQAAAKLRTEQVSAIASRSDDYGGFASGSGKRRIGIGGMGGVQFAAVRVDTETGIIAVERVVAVHDCGRPLNPLAIESQVNGGIIQGLSYALYEDRVLDVGRGVMLNPNLEMYKIAGAREIPDIEVVLIEEYRGRTSTDASGIGEPATVPTAAAIANAVYNAIGVRLRELPMTPARVLAALGDRRGG